MSSCECSYVQNAAQYMPELQGFSMKVACTILGIQPFWRVLPYSVHEH